jgi:PAS domain S-box-containing protein
LPLETDRSRDRGGRGERKESRVSNTEQPGLSQALIEHLSDAVIFADREGLIRVWNAGAEAVFGYSADQVLGRRLDVLIPERLRPAHWAGFDAAVKTARMKHGRQSITTRAIHKDGSALYVDVSFALVTDGAGQVLGSVAVARDTTSRFRAEKESRKRLAELEAQVKALSPGSRPSVRRKLILGAPASKNSIDSVASAKGEEL